MVKTLGLKYKHGAGIIVEAWMRLTLWLVLAIMLSCTMVQAGE